MTFHLFGNVLTGYGMAANNRGENDGNITTLQKLLWKGEVHTTVSAEAIRWALRYYWQTSDSNCAVNRRWDDEKNDNIWQNLSFDDETFIDDDVLGFMRAEAAKEEATAEGVEICEPRHALPDQNPGRHASLICRGHRRGMIRIMSNRTTLWRNAGLERK